MLEEDPFTRMKMVVRWYLSGFYKKPKVRCILCCCTVSNCWCYVHLHHLCHALITLFIFLVFVFL